MIFPLITRTMFWALKKSIKNGVLAKWPKNWILNFPFTCCRPSGDWFYLSQNLTWTAFLLKTVKSMLYLGYILLHKMYSRATQFVALRICQDEFLICARRHQCRQVVFAKSANTRQANKRCLFITQSGITCPSFIYKKFLLTLNSSAEYRKASEFNFQFKVETAV